MKKEHLLTYLEDTLSQDLDGDSFAIDWDVKNHSIEVIVRLFAENREGESIEDSEGILSAEEVIEFEDGILLYDQQKSVLEEEDYLAVIPFAGKKGIEKGTIKALSAYLAEVLSEGESDLLDFVNDETIEVFELHWDSQVFAEKVQQAMNQNDGSEFIAYPSY